MLPLALSLAVSATAAVAGAAYTTWPLPLASTHVRAGTSIAADATGLVVVGAPSVRTGAASTNGTAEVFDCTAAPCRSIALLAFDPRVVEATGEPTFPGYIAEFGAAAAVQAPRVVIGVPGVGMAFVYTCDVSTGACTAEIDGLYSLTSISPLTQGDRFGSAVGMAGSGGLLAVVGAFNRTDDFAGPIGGTAYSFVCSPGSSCDVNTEAGVVPPFGAAYDCFGQALAVNAGGVAVFGAPGVNASQGAVLVTSCTAASYCDTEFTATLVGRTGPVGGGDRFGAAVAVDPLNHVAVGAPGAGSVRVYECTVTVADSALAACSAAILIQFDGNVTASEFGAAVAIYGATVAVGAPGADNGNGTVYIYACDYGVDARNCTLVDTLVSSADVVGSRFGSSLAFLNQTALLIGGPASGLNGSLIGTATLAVGTHTHTPSAEREYREWARRCQ